MQIQGLTRQQMLLAEKLWRMETMEEVEQFISQLPRSRRRDAWVVTTMFVAETLDDVDVIDPELNQYLRSL